MKETWKLIALMAIGIGVILAYAFVPEGIGEKMPFKQMSMEAICNESTATLTAMADSAEQKEETTDSTSQRILLFGDSMSQPIALRLADWANHNGHTLTAVTWVSSGTSKWASCDTLDHYMRSVKPTHVFICLGSNELYSADENGCKKRMQAILQKIGSVPAVWIGPPNWCEDHGYNKWLLEVMGTKRFYPSYKLTFERQSDGRHPTQKASDMWVDKLMEWMNSGHSIHPFVMQKPDKKDRHYKQVVLSPTGTKHSDSGNAELRQENAENDIEIMPEGDALHQSATDEEKHSANDSKVSAAEKKSTEKTANEKKPSAEKKSDKTIGYHEKAEAAE